MGLSEESIVESFKMRHVAPIDSAVACEVSLSWMQGLDEVEEWLRRRTVLLTKLRIAVAAVISSFMRQHGQSVMDGFLYES